MKIREFRFIHNKKEFKGNVGIPENIREATQILGEGETFKCFLAGYIEDQKRLIRGAARPRKYIRIETAHLTEEERVLAETLIEKSKSRAHEKQEIKAGSFEGGKHIPLNAVAGEEKFFERPQKEIPIENPEDVTEEQLANEMEDVNTSSEEGSEKISREEWESLGLSGEYPFLEEKAK